MSDSVSRQDVIRWIKVECNPYGKPTLDYESGKRVIKYLERMPSAEPEVIHCKDCQNRGEDECPMRHVERIEWEEDGYIEVDDVTHDWTTDEGFCHCAELRGDPE